MKAKDQHPEEKDKMKAKDQHPEEKDKLKAKDQHPEEFEIGGVVPQKVSAPLLMRKFKITYEFAQKIVDCFAGCNVDNGWINVGEDLPKHHQEVVVHAKLLHEPIETFNYYIAIFDRHCGWLEFYSNEFLYVKSWKILSAEDKKEEENKIKEHFAPMHYYGKK